MAEKEKNIQVKMTTFTKMYYLSNILPSMCELGEIELPEEIYKDLLLVQDDLSSRMDAKKAREEYTKNILNKNK